MNPSTQDVIKTEIELKYAKIGQANQVLTFALFADVNTIYIAGTLEKSLQTFFCG